MRAASVSSWTRRLSGGDVIARALRALGCMGTVAAAVTVSLAMVLACSPVPGSSSSRRVTSATSCRFVRRCHVLPPPG